ncbi:unnamed protein product, partial [Prorocentrum cordatum]
DFFQSRAADFTSSGAFRACIAMDTKAADVTIPAIVVVVAYAGSLIYHGATFKEFFTFTNKSDYVFLATMAVHMLKCCNDARGAVKGVYWPAGALVFSDAALHL